MFNLFHLSKCLKISTFYSKIFWSFSCLTFYFMLFLKIMISILEIKVHSTCKSLKNTSLICIWKFCCIYSFYQALSFITYPQKIWENRKSNLISPILLQLLKYFILLNKESRSYFAFQDFSKIFQIIFFLSFPFLSKSSPKNSSF